MPKIIIIGGGIAGLAAAAHLKAGARAYGKPMDVLVLEKSGRIGGKMLTERHGDFLIEGGPDSFLPEKVWTINLARHLGLGNELLPSNDEHKGTYIFSGGALHPLPEGVMMMVPTAFKPLAQSKLISWLGKVRMGMDLLVPRGRAGQDESLASFVTRRLGRECLEKIAEPLIAGIHTSNPDNMSVLATFPRFVEMERKNRSLILAMIAAMKERTVSSLSAAVKPGAVKMTYFMSFKNGMQSLSDAAASFIGPESIRTNAAVRGIERRERSYLVTLENGEALEADQIMLATASYEASELVKGFEGSLSDQLSKIEWSSSATVSLAFRKEDITRPLQGFGFIVPRIEGRRINAATFSSIKWSYRAPEDHVLIRGFVGGGHHEELVQALDDPAMVGMVLEELGTILGIKANPVFSKVYRWVKGMPKYTVGHLDRISVLERTLASHPGLHLIGCSYKGIGLGDCIHQAQIAAEKILKPTV